MPTVTAVQATVPTSTDQHNLVATPTTRTTLLRLPRRRHATFPHLLQTLIRSWATRRFMEKPRLNPAYPRQETGVDRVVRIDPYVYIRSLSG